MKPTQLPATTPASSGEFYTAPFGPGGTWNLYEVVGCESGIPATMYDAEVAASTRPNPLGTGLVPGHLPTLETREGSICSATPHRNEGLLDGHYR